MIRLFSWHARRQHENQRRGVTQPEHFTGFISSESGEAFIYHAPRLLTPSGVVYAKGLLNPPATPAGIAPRIDAHCYALSPGAVAGNACLVYCPETRVAVEESMKLWDWSIKEHPLFFAPRFPPSTHLPGTGLLVGVLGIESFYHLLLECLPKLALTRRWWNSIDHFIVNGKSGGFAEK